MMPDFIKEIMRQDIPNSFFSIKTQSQRFLEELQSLFAMMIRSNRSFVEPHKVVELLIEKGIRRGEQMDVGEFNLFFVNMIESAIGSSLSGFLYGKTKTIVSAQEPDGSKSTDSHTEIFSHIILDIEENDLHSAWSTAYDYKVEDYLTKSNTKVEGRCKVLKIP